MPNHEAITINTIRIVVVNLKGGTGKTTTATSAAHHFGAFLVDLDPQGDSADWAKRSGLVRAIHAKDWKEALALVDQESGPVVMECPPGEGPALRAALSVADVAIVPTKSSAQDLRAVGRMLHLAEEARAVNPGLVVGLVLNEAKLNTTAAQETERDLKGLDGAHFLGTIGSRQAIPDAFTNGTAVPSGPAHHEFMNIFSALEEIIVRNK
jgi:cellulose biosynthesis protein BcsQ